MHASQNTMSKGTNQRQVGLENLLSILLPGILSIENPRTTQVSGFFRINSLSITYLKAVLRKATRLSGQMAGATCLFTFITKVLIVIQLSSI